jgi:hypothetical protein
MVREYAARAASLKLYCVAHLHIVKNTLIHRSSKVYCSGKGLEISSQILSPFPEQIYLPNDTIYVNSI